MSVVFVTFSSRAIVMCADKLTTHPNTGAVSTTKKIEKWSPSLAVGGAGNAGLWDTIPHAVHGVLTENGNNIDNFTLEEIADSFAQCYYATRETYAHVMPKDTSANFVVAGKLSNGRFGVIQISVGNDTADSEVYEVTDAPQTIILGPGDISDDECNQMLRKAFLDVSLHPPRHKDPIELAHRKAVQYVSERSKFVGSPSDYIVITPNTKK